MGHQGVADHRKAALLSYNALLPEGETSNTAAMAVMLGLEVGNRPADVDDWLTKRLASAPDQVYNRCRKGMARPTVLRNIDREATTLDRALNARLTEVIEAELARLLRSAGLKVLGAIRDDNVRAELQSVDLTDVARRAHIVVVAGGRTAMSVSTVQLNDMIDQAAERLERRAEELLERADLDARAVIEDHTNTESTDPSPLSIPAVVGRILLGFRSLARRRLGITPSPEDPSESEIGEKSSGAVSPGIVAGAITEGLDSAGIGAGIGFASVVQRLLLGAPSRNPDVFPAVVDGRASIGAVFIWRTNWFGKPRTNFPPHEVLNGLIAGSREYEALANEAFERELSDGSLAVDPPFSIGGWHPQDHLGCVCSYEVRTVLNFR